jgi:two-component system, chemotaxis family, protein-glutamate methylesterase/glutaminase
MSVGGGGHDLVVIGASWGGLDALRTLLAQLPAELDASLVVAQHRAPESHPTAFRNLLAAVTRLRVCDVEDKQPLKPGTVFLAPADYHSLVEGDHLALSIEDPVAFSRPSIDVLFESAADAFRERCVGVVLTGANDDGARGLRRIADLGGEAIVQDPETAERREMPAAALAAVPGAHVAHVGELAGLLVELCGSAKVAV